MTKRQNDKTTRTADILSSGGNRPASVERLPPSLGGWPEDEQLLWDRQVGQNCFSPLHSTFLNIQHDNLLQADSGEVSHDQDGTHRGGRGIPAQTPCRPGASWGRHLPLQEQEYGWCSYRLAEHLGGGDHQPAPPLGVPHH